jgi:zinc protease
MLFKNININFPFVKSKIIDNGLKLIFAEHHEQEGVVIAFQLPFGNFNEPIDFEGITSVIVNTILKGPAGMTCEEFAEKIESCGGTLFTDIGNENCIIGCKFLSRSLDVIIPLFWEMIINPALHPKEIERIKKEIQTSIQSELVDPYAIANKHFGNVLCGKDHPAGKFETIKSISRINHNNVKEYYNKYFCPLGSVLMFCGDFDSEKILINYEKIFSKWNKKIDGNIVIAPPIKNLSENKIRLIDKSDLTQASIVIGHPTCSELDTMKCDVLIANYILGGGNFSSRLMENIRSKEGKTYTIASLVSFEKKFGIFSISTSTINQKVKDMLENIFNIYKTFGEKGITKEELENAKKYLLGNITFQFEGIVNIAEKILWLEQFSRKFEYFEEFILEIKNTTVKKVNEAIKKYFYSKYFAMAVAGKKDEILPILKYYGDVEVINYKKIL